MEDFMESGPTIPRTEAEKIGESLYNVLKRRYSDSTISSGYIANGNPRTVHITFTQFLQNPEDTATLDHFCEDAQDIIDSYDIDRDVMTVTFGRDGQNTYEIIITPH